MSQNYHFYLIKAWFLINLFVSLYPPLYWEIGSSPKLLFGLPIAFIYFISIGISITLSILYAYWEEASREEWI